jgi:hypothetical protein
MTLHEIKEQAQIYISNDYVAESLEFAQKIEQSIISNNVAQNNPQAYRELSQIIFYLYVAAIPNVKKDLFENIIKLNIIEALNPLWKSQKTLIELIESRYSIYPVEVMKDYIRNDCLPALQSNQQLIGTTPLYLSQDIPQANPSVAHWLEYYDKITGIHNTTNFERSKFFSSDSVVQTLTPEEKSTLRNIIQFYDYLQSEEIILYAEDTPSTPINTTVSDNISHQTTPETIPSDTARTSPGLSVSTNKISIPPTSTPRSIMKSPPGTIVLTPKIPPKPQNLLNLKKPE